MRTLLTTMVTFFAMTLVFPAMAVDVPQQAEDAGVQDARSRSRSKAKKAKASSSHRRSNGNHGGNHNGNHNANQNNGHGNGHSSSRHVTHHSSRHVVHHGASHSRRVVIAPRPAAVVVHPSRPGRDRTVSTVAVNRRADKANRFSIGGGIGVMSSKTFDRSDFANVGVEAQARYRIADPLGLEVSLGYYGDMQPDVKRIDVPFTTSVMLHTPGYIPVGAFVLAGVTLNYRDYDLTCKGGQHLRGGLVGGHVGAGVNLNLGDDVTLEWDVRYTRYFNETNFDQGGTSRHNIGTSLALNVFF